MLPPGVFSQPMLPPGVFRLIVFISLLPVNSLFRVSDISKLDEDETQRN